MLILLKNANSNLNGNSNHNLAHVQTATSEKINLNTGILLNSGISKHRKVNKISSLYSTIAENNEKNNNLIKNNNKSQNKGDLVVDKTTDLGRSTNLLEKAYEASKTKYSDMTTKKIDLSKSGPILMHSWVKHFKYNDEFSEDEKARLKITSAAPKKFFINNEYKEQLKFFPGQDYAQKDKDNEYQFVKSQDFFYLIVYKNIVTIFSTKQVSEILKILNKNQIKINL